MQLTLLQAFSLLPLPCFLHPLFPNPFFILLLPFLLSIVILFMTGCSVTKLDNNNISKNMKTLLSEKSNLYNVFYGGYKYYLPKGVGFISKDDYNAVIKDSNGILSYKFIES